MSPIEDTVISRQGIRKYIKRYLHLQEVLGKNFQKTGRNDFPVSGAILPVQPVSRGSVPDNRKGRPPFPAAVLLFASMPVVFPDALCLAERVFPVLFRLLFRFCTLAAGGLSFCLLEL